MVWRLYSGAVWLVFLWAAWNCVYVYLVLGGERSYRVESATWILVAVLAPLLFAGSPDRVETVKPDRRERRLLVTLAVGLWLALLLPFLSFSFLSDDFVFLGRYRTIGDVLHPSQFFRPLFALVFWGLSLIGPGSPIPFHALGLCLHLGSAWLVYLLVGQLTGRPSQALAALVVFLLNPLQLEAVLWVSGLQELLWAFFLLLALKVYLGARELTPARIAATLILVCAALLSKETAACFVLLLPACDLLFFHMRRGRTLFAAYAVFAAVLLGYLAVRQHFALIDDGYLQAPSRYFLKQFFSTPYRAFAHPWNWSAIGVPWTVVCALSLLLIGALTIRVAVIGASSRLLAGPALILISTLPLSSYLYVGSDLVAARYLYLASAGWGLFVSDLLRVIRGRVATISAIAALALTSAFWLSVNLRPWRVAEDVVHTMRAGIMRGEDPAVTIAAWQASHAAPLIVKDGLPYDYQGVGIFINGYAEFRRLVESDRSRSPAPDSGRR